MPYPKGKPQSEESKAKRRATMLRRMEDAEFRAKVEANLALADRVEAGRKGGQTSRSPSEETRAKISETLTGRKDSGETIERKRDAQRAHSATPKGRATLEKMWSALAFRETKPERIVSEALTPLGVIFRKNVKVKGCGHHPYDFVLDELKAVIEVDGCYWHGCEVCGFGGSSPRLDDRRRRDRDADLAARGAGWRVIRIWEHDLQDDAVDLVGLIVSELQPALAA
jgi:DNA mismatch endonuclease (patch repair protein)